MLKTKMKQKFTSSLTCSWGTLLVKWYPFKQKLHIETNARWYSFPNENCISENNTNNQAQNSAVSMATRLALLVFLNCWMTWKNHKPNKINPNCLLYTMVMGVWVMKIQVNPLLQMPGNDVFYFRVMSMLYIRDKKTNTKEKQKKRNQCYETHG